MTERFNQIKAELEAMTPQELLEDEKVSRAYVGLWSGINPGAKPTIDETKDVFELRSVLYQKEGE